MWFSWVGKMARVYLEADEVDKLEKAEESFLFTFRSNTVQMPVQMSVQMFIILFT